MPMLHLKAYHCKKKKNMLRPSSRKRRKETRPDAFLKKSIFSSHNKLRFFSWMTDFFVGTSKESKGVGRQSNQALRQHLTDHSTTGSWEVGSDVASMIMKYKWVVLVVGGWNWDEIHAAGTCGSNQCIAKSFWAFSRIIYFNAWEALLLCLHMIKPSKSVKDAPLPETSLLFPCNL